MGANTPSAWPAGASSETDRDLAALCDPVALEARLKAARARRAEAIARRKAGLDQPAPRRAPMRGFAEPDQPAFAGTVTAAPHRDTGRALVAAVRERAHRAVATMGRPPRLVLPLALAGIVVLTALAVVTFGRTPAQLAVEAPVPAAPVLVADAPPPAAIETAPQLARPQPTDDAPTTEARTDSEPPPVEIASLPAATDAALPAATDLPVAAQAAGTDAPSPDAEPAPVLAPLPRAAAMPAAVPAVEAVPAETAAAARPEQVLVYVSAGQAGAPLTEALGAAGFTAVTTQPSRYPISSSNVRYYHASDAAAAAAIAEALGPSLPDGQALVRDFTQADRRTAAGRIEVWIAGNPAARAAPARAPATESDEIQRLVESVLAQPAVSSTLRAVDRGLQDLDRGMQRTATEIERSLRNATR